MRQNIHYSNLSNNNNNSNNSRNGSLNRKCNVDNAYNYYNNAAIPIDPACNQQTPISKSNPSNDVAVRHIWRTSYQTAANLTSDEAHYRNAFLSAHTRSSNSSKSSHNKHMYQQLERSENAYHSPEYKIRQYVIGPPTGNTNFPTTSTFTNASNSLEKERAKRQARIRERLHLEVTPTYQQNYTPEPTWDSILSDPPSHSTDQHYEHYFSYFYNRGRDKPTSKSNPASVSRKLPMNTYKDTIHQRDSRSVDAHKKLSNRRDVSNDTNRNPQYEQVLKEKLPNNNISVSTKNTEWAADEYDSTALAKAGEEYLGIKDIYEAEKLIDTSLDSGVSLQRQYQRLAAGDAFINNNNNVTHPSFRLPLTAKRVKNGAVPKKILPTVHRVLLYNNQSPRMPRKQQSAVQRNQSARQQTSKAGGDTVFLFDPHVKQPENVSRSPIDFNGDDDYDDDDELDNLSDFDGSDTSSVTSDLEDGYKAHAYKLTHSADRFATLDNSPGQQSCPSSEDDIKNPDSLLVPSLFPHVPPYLSFSSNTKRGPQVPADLHRVLKWRITSIMPKVVRLILSNSGMRMLKNTNEWMGVWGKHLKSPCFKTIRSYQKINHLPGSFRIGRKDSCWKNLQKQMNKHSNREFGFMPRTYIIPNDLSILRKHWPKYAQRNTKWIIKPPASARGAGIRVISRWGQIPKRRPLIVQKYDRIDVRRVNKNEHRFLIPIVTVYRYIERPLLINGSKFDLRLYVLVTSVNPLRVFMYHNGLARFASVKYSAKVDTLNDRCMHLTNYSINKFSSNYSKNEDVNACHGHKWTIKSLWTYLANRGVHTDSLWEALRALVLRTILAGENGINNMIRANVESKYSCFELFGFDVILDADLVPWLLEVNISPSLHSELPLDAHVKAPLVQGVLNTALYNVPPKLSHEKQKELAAEFSLPTDTQMCYDKRLYINYLSREEKVKHNTFTRKSMENREEYIDAILAKLTPDDVRCLIIAEDELARCAPLERIFPTDQTYKYLKYNDSPRYYNRLLDAWESRYANNRMEGILLLREFCETKYHLQVPSPPAKKPLTLRSRTLVLTKSPLRGRWVYRMKPRLRKSSSPHTDEEEAHADTPHLTDEEATAPE